jgi:ComF family protein
MNSLSSLISKLKFQHKINYAQPLGILLAKKLSTLYQVEKLQLPDCIMPIPLSKQRLRERGYNQALEIARPVAKCLNVKLDYKSLKRVKPTLPQTLIAHRQRKTNVKNAFSFSAARKINHVAMIDDVATTFSTLSEAARTLKKAGVARVDVGCLARAQQ